MGGYETLEKLTLKVVSLRANFQILVSFKLNDWSANNKKNFILLINKEYFCIWQTCLYRIKKYNLKDCISKNIVKSNPCSILPTSDAVYFKEKWMCLFYSQS